MRTNQQDIVPKAPAFKWGNGGGSSGAIADVGSNDWSMTRTALGVYVVTFIKPFANVPVVVVSPHYGGAPGVSVDIQARSATGFTVAVFAQPGTAVDSNVMFVAIGQSK